MKDFEIIEHTADTGVRAFGSSIEEAYVNAARGMFSIISESSDTAIASESFDIQVQAPDREALLVAWLGELLYLYDSRNVLLGRFRIEQMDETSLHATAWGEEFDQEKHVPGVDVKAVTWHMLSVRQENSGWTAEVIFDI